MDNKYVYLSSIGSDNASDFMVQFPNTINISPYSQVRLISAHIKAENNNIQITDDNNTFYMGVDFWNKTTGSIPLQKIKVDNGIYTLEKFAEELESTINGKLCELNALLFRGCVVSVNPDDEFEIELYKMDLPGCPKIPIPEVILYDDGNFVYESWQEQNITPFFVKDGNIFDKINLENTSELIYEEGDEIYYGLNVENPTDGNSFFIGPTISSGLLGNDLDFPISINRIDLSGSGIIENEDYLQVWCGNCNAPALQDENLGWGDFLNDDLETVPFKTVHRFCAQFMSDRLRIVYTDILEGLPNVNIVEVLEEDGYDNDGLYFLKCYDSYDDVSSYWHLNILKDNVTVVNIEVRQNLIEKTTSRFAERNINNNVSFIKKGCVESLISFSCAYFGRDELNYFNSERNEFFDYDRYKTFENFFEKDGIFQDRPISFFLNSDEEFKPFISDVIDNSSYDSDALYNWNLTLPTPANSGIFYESGNEKDSSWVFVDETPALSWSELNFSSLPQAYLEIPELPLNNFTANYLQGSAQKFISPINFNFDSQTDQSNALYTSNPNTEQFLTMSNSSKMVLSSFRVRICDITGKIFPLQPDTIITLEIRENPTLRKERAQEQFISSIISKMSSNGQPGTVQNAKALDGF
jgi:hypothetical protein